MDDQKSGTTGDAAVVICAVEGRAIGIARFRISVSEALSTGGRLRSAASEGRARAEARRACVRAAKAVERAGLKVEWVRRLARRLVQLNEARAVVVRQAQ